MLRQGVQSCFGHRIGGRGSRLHGLAGPHRSDIDDRTAAFASDHVLGHALRDEKKGPGNLKRKVIVGLSVLEKGLRSEYARGIDKQGCVRVPCLEMVDQTGTSGAARYVHGPTGTLPT